jgi:hypothetical protein
MVSIKALFHFLHELFATLSALPNAHALTAASTLALSPLTAHALTAWESLSTASLALTAHALAHTLTEATAELPLALALTLTHSHTLTLPRPRRHSLLAGTVLAIPAWRLELANIWSYILG